MIIAIGIISWLELWLSAFLRSSNFIEYFLAIIICTNIEIDAHCSQEGERQFNEYKGEGHIVPTLIFQSG